MGGRSCASLGPDKSYAMLSGAHGFWPRGTNIIFRLASRPVAALLIHQLRIRSAVTGRVLCLGVMTSVVSLGKQEELKGTR